MNYPDGHYLIAQDIFRKGKKCMLNVINHGQMVNEVITYINREGKQEKNVFDIVTDSIFVFPVAELNIKDSLYHWYKNNPKHSNKELVYKDDLTNGENFKMFGWSYAIMLSYDDNNIYYKINFE